MKINNIKKFVAGTIALTAIANFNINQATAAAIDWQNLWDCDSNDKSRTFHNVDGTGVDVNVEYTSNIDGDLKLYSKEGQSSSCRGSKKHDLWAYDGVLRTTAGSDAKPTHVKISFSEPVYLSDFWVGNLSRRTRSHGDQYEWIEISAYGDDHVDLSNLTGSQGNLVAASNVAHYDNFFGFNCPYQTVSQDDHGNDCNVEGTDNPNYVEIIDDGSSVYKLKGVGYDKNDEKGRVFAAYEDTPVQTVVVSMYVTDARTGNVVRSSSSAAISPSMEFYTVHCPDSIVFAD